MYELWYMLRSGCVSKMKTFKQNSLKLIQVLQGNKVSGSISHELKVLMRDLSLNKTDYYRRMNGYLCVIALPVMGVSFHIYYWFIYTHLYLLMSILQCWFVVGFVAHKFVYLALVYNFAEFYLIVALITLVRQTVATKNKQKPMKN